MNDDRPDPISNVPAPTMDHVMAAVNRRRASRYRAVSGAVGAVLIGGIAYVGLSRSPSAQLVGPIAPPNVSQTPIPTTLPDYSTPCPVLGQEQPDWLIEASDRTLEGPHSEQALEIAEAWTISAVDIKALFDLLGPDYFIHEFPNAADIAETFAVDSPYSVESVHALSDAWAVDPVTIKAMALSEIDRVVAALDGPPAENCT